MGHRQRNLKQKKYKSNVSMCLIKPALSLAKPFYLHSNNLKLETKYV